MASKEKNYLNDSYRKGVSTEFKASTPPDRRANGAGSPANGNSRGPQGNK